MKSKSHTLFHFTDSIDTLLKILKSGFWPRYCAEDFRWYNEAMGYVSYPMVSFCDIPLTRIREHTEFYGKFGIGMSRDWGISAGLNPVIYLTEKSTLRFSLLQLAQPKKFVTPPNESVYVDHFFELLAHIKPISGKMLKTDGDQVEKDFCSESEWRYYPVLEKSRKCIPIEKHRSEKFSYDRFTFENSLLKFSLTDVAYLIVEHDDDCIGLINEIDALAEESKSSSEANKLKARIISLESISRDF